MTHVYPVPLEWAARAKIDAERYDRLYAESISHPEAFWQREAQRLEWMTPFTKVKNASFNEGDFGVKWFEDGVLNVSANCIDRHLAERGDAVAILWEGDSPGEDRRITYRDLHEEVCRLANAAGLTVVTTPVGGVPDLIADGRNGLLVQPGDVPALAVAINRLLDDPALRCAAGDLNRQQVVAEYDVPRYVERFAPFAGRTFMPTFLPAISSCGTSAEPRSTSASAPNPSSRRPRSRRGIESSSAMFAWRFWKRRDIRRKAFRSWSTI